MRAPAEAPLRALAAIEEPDRPDWPPYVAARAHLGALLKCPCTWGVCGHCTNGDHDRCAFVRLGGTVAYNRDKTNVWLVNSKHYALAPVYADGTHDWRCQCDIDGHPGREPKQLDMLDYLDEVAA